MAQLASCPRCGLSMQVLDLGGSGPPLCPSCAGPMDEVPDADLVAEGPPLDRLTPELSSAAPLPPLGGGWHRVDRGLALVRLGLMTFFGGWGLIVMATFAIVVFGIVDRERAVQLLVPLALLSNLLGVITCALFAAGRLSCCAFDEKPSVGPRLLRFSVGATLLAVLAWLGLLVLSLPWLDLGLPGEALWFGWALGVACTCQGEVMFLLFVREAGRCLRDRVIQDRVTRFFGGLDLFVAILLACMVAVPLLGTLLLPGEGHSVLFFGLVVLTAVVVLGVSSTTLVVRYLLAVNAARQSIRDRLEPRGVMATG